MLHEVKIYNKSGRLKSVITSEQVTEKHQMNYQEGSIFSKMDNAKTKICKHCKKKFETRDRRKKFCSLLACGKAYHMEIYRKRRIKPKLPDRICAWTGCTSVFTPRNKKQVVCTEYGKLCAKKYSYMRTSIKYHAEKVAKLARLAELKAGETYGV